MTTLYDVIKHDSDFEQHIYNAVADSLKQFNNEELKQLVHDWARDHNKPYQD